jgi:hypothetical protein
MPEFGNGAAVAAHAGDANTEVVLH